MESINVSKKLPIQAHPPPKFPAKDGFIKTSNLRSPLPPYNTSFHFSLSRARDFARWKSWRLRGPRGGNNPEIQLGEPRQKLRPSWIAPLNPRKASRTLAFLTRHARWEIAFEIFPNLCVASAGGRAPAGGGRVRGKRVCRLFRTSTSTWQRRGNGPCQRPFVAERLIQLCAAFPRGILFVAIHYSRWRRWEGSAGPRGDKTPVERLGRNEQFHLWRRNSIYATWKCCESWLAAVGRILGRKWGANGGREGLPDLNTGVWKVGDGIFYGTLIFLSRNDELWS